MTNDPRPRTTFSLAAALPLIVTGAAIAAAEVGRRAYRETHIFEPSPDPVFTWDPRDYGIPEGATEEIWIDTPDGERLHAWYCRSANPRASALFCHGNTGNLTVSAHSIPYLLRAGLSVLFFDYRGYGKSSGKATVSGVIADAVTAAQVHEDLRPRNLPSILYGFSLGGAIAAQVIQQHPFDALILQSTFTSLRDITRQLYPRFPLHLLAGGMFDTLGAVRRLRVPLLVLHGTADEVVPCSMAHSLFEACPTARRIHPVEGALHKDIFVRDPDAAAREIGRFLEDVAAEPPRQGPAVEQRHSWMQTVARAARRMHR